MSKQQTNTEKMNVFKEKQVQYFLKEYGWSFKNEDDKGLARQFYEWGFSDAIQWFLDNQEQFVSSGISEK